MTDKLFDQFIKTRLESYDSGAPMHVWERMQKERDDRKGFFFFKKKFLFLAAGLILAAGTGYLALSSNKNNEQKNKVQKQITFSNNQNKSEVSAKPSQKSSSSILKEVHSNENDGANTSADLLNNQSANNVINSSAISKQKAENGFKPAILKTVKKEAVNRQTVRRENKQSKNQFSSSETIVTENKINTAQNLSLKRMGVELIQKKKPLLQLGAVNLPLNRPSCPTINGPRRRDLYLEAYLSPDYNVRNLSSGNTTSTYLNERRSTEDYRTSYSAGVRLVKNLGEKTLIKAGVNYSQINERLKLVSENSKQLTQVITIRTVVRAPGDTLFVRDTMYYEQTGTRYRTTYNRYRFIDIPLIFSYEFGNPELLHFSINAGPVFNIISMYRGEVLDTSYKPVRISTTTGSNVNNWRNNIGVGFFASMSIYKRLNDRIHLFGEPYLRYNINPVTQSANLVKQRYFNTGMQLGIRYNLLPKGQRYR